jgi:hypothetical protein
MLLRFHIRWSLLQSSTCWGLEELPVVAGMRSFDRAGKEMTGQGGIRVMLIRILTTVRGATND